MKCLSTRKAAAKVGIDRSTIQKWIRKNRVSAPRVSLQGKRKVRCWDKKGLAELRKLTKSWKDEQRFWEAARGWLKADNERRKRALEERKRAKLEVK